VYEQKSGGRTRFDCALVDGKWACGYGDYAESWKTPGKDREPTFGFKPVDAIRLEIKPDFTLELSVGGEKRWAVPLDENRMAYDEGAYFIAKGIRIKELDRALAEGRSGMMDGKKTFTLKRVDDENGFRLDQGIVSDSDERKVELLLEKIK
jgi:hypothetical protein